MSMPRNQRYAIVATLATIAVLIILLGWLGYYSNASQLKPIENTVGTAPAPLVANDQYAMSDTVREPAPTKGSSIRLADGSLLVYGDDVKLHPMSPGAEPMESHSAYAFIQKNGVVQELIIPNDAPAASSAILTGSTVNTAVARGSTLVISINGVEGHAVGSGSGAIYQYDIVYWENKPKLLVYTDTPVKEMEFDGNSVRYMVDGEWKSKPLIYN